MKKIIGLTGVKGSGKTTTFNFIKQLCPAAIEIMIANKLKDVCAKVFNIPRIAFDDPKLKEVELSELVELDTDNISECIKLFNYTPDFDSHIRPHIGKVLVHPRQVAQYIGTEVLRSVDPVIHCKQATVGMPEDGIFVVTDIRFPNEYDFFANDSTCEFHPFYVKNTGAECAMDTHSSEAFILEIGKKCVTLNNDGTIQELASRVEKLVGAVLCP